MKKLALFLLALPTLMFAQQPKLVVGIVVDQMRFEMLERYQASFSDNGFKRLQTQGFSFDNCHYNYIPTYTGPGHATIFSGKTPKNHGIVANDWYNRAENKMVYCVEDNSVKPIGGDGYPRSPKNFQAQSLADMVKRDKVSKSFGISVKDRGAILPAGQLANGAFWMNDKAEFISSNYYGKALPEWLLEFNEAKHSSKYAQLTWELSLPENAYSVSDADDRPCEVFGLKNKPVFPYPLKKAAEQRGPAIIKYTPFGNTILTDLAIELLKNEALGQDEHMDFLTISYSSTDYAGHVFGPRSVEVQDMYIKLDLELARLMAYLDEQVGEGQYLLFLTSDHGVVDCPGTAANPNEYIDSDAIKARIDSICEAEYGGPLVSKVTNYQIWFDHALVNDLFLNVDDVAFVVLEKMKEYKGGKYFANSWTKGDLMTCNEPTCLQIKNAMRDDLAGDAFFMTKEGFLLSSQNTGTSHGTGYSYDTHVPFLIYGANVEPGTSNEPIVIPDIAPTILSLMEVMPDEDLDGESRLDLMR